MELEQTLDNFREFLKTIIQKFQALEKDLGGYTLKTFQVSLDLKGTIFVITADGSVTLSFSK